MTKKRAVADGSDAEIIASSTMEVVPLDMIEVDEKWNTRKDAGDISELTESLRTNGMQTPVRVQAPRKEGGKYFLVYGFRRVAAARAAGMTEIPSCVEPASSSTARLLALNVQENVNRKQLNPMEEAEGASRMMAEGLSEDLVMKLLGWSRTMLTQRLKLMDCSGAVKDALRASRITIQHARTISRCDEEDHEKFILKAEELTTTALDDLVNRHLTPPESRDDSGDDEPSQLLHNDDDDEEDTDAPDPTAMAKSIRQSLQSIAELVHWSEGDQPTLAAQLGRIGNMPLQAMPLAGLQTLSSFVLVLESALRAAVDEDDAHPSVTIQLPAKGKVAAPVAVHDDEEEDEDDDF